MARPPRPSGQTWSVFLNNHAKDVWAYDFLGVIDLLFRQVYLFFIVEVGSRRIVHFGVTAHPTDSWVAQQLREATPYGQPPRFLIRDRDSKYGQAFTQVAKGCSIEILKAPYRAPKAKARTNHRISSSERTTSRLPTCGMNHQESVEQTRTGFLVSTLWRLWALN